MATDYISKSSVCFIDLFNDIQRKMDCAVLQIVCLQWISGDSYIDWM